MTPERRHSRAKKKTVATPLSTNAHHCQFPATPYWRTCCVTQFGVSLLNVVATIESPASHHGTERPEAKNSEVLFPASFPKKRAGKKQMIRMTTVMTQSTVCRCMGADDTSAGHGLLRPHRNHRLHGRRASRGGNARQHGD